MSAKDKAEEPGGPLGSVPPDSAMRQDSGPGHSLTGNPRACAQTRDTATLASGTLISRLLGFARDLLIAYVLGPAADAFILAFRLPNFFRRLLAEGSLGMAHAADEARIMAEHGASAAQGFARSVRDRKSVV